MGRRWFDHVYVEASVAAGRRLPRYALWLAFHADGRDPEALGRDDALAFCRRALPRFLEAEGLRLGPRAARRLERAVVRFDAARPSPYERFAAF